MATQLHQKNTSIDWDTYNTKTDILFQKLSDQHLVEKEGIIITGVIGVPWAKYGDDSVAGNSGMPAKRMLHVLLDDNEIDAFVVSYYAPNINGTGFAGMFRQYPSDGDQRMLSSSTSYVPGMIVSTFVFAKDNGNIDENSIVKKELALMGEIQTMLEDEQ